MDRPPEEVWRFLADEQHLGLLIAHEAGDTIQKTSDGPLAFGATLQIRGEFRGRAMAFDARISEFEPNRTIAIEYVSGPFRGSRKIYLLEPHPSEPRSELVHTSVGEFHGVWKLLAVLVRPMVVKGVRKSAEDELAGIVRGLSA